MTPLDSQGRSLIENILLGLGLLGAFIVVLIGFLFFQSYKQAEIAAKVLCDHAIVGGPVEGLEAKAKELGMRTRSVPEAKDPGGHSLAPGKFSGSMSYSPVGGFGCEIEHAEGKVIAKRRLRWD